MATVMHMQKRITAEMELNRAKEFKFTADQKARAVSAAQPGASLWLTTVPHESALRLSCRDFGVAVCFRIGVVMRDAQCGCGKPITDDDPEHAQRCRNGGRVVRHDMIVQALNDLGRRAGADVQVEKRPEDKRSVSDRICCLKGSI